MMSPIKLRSLIAHEVVTSYVSSVRKTVTYNINVYQTLPYHVIYYDISDNINHTDSKYFSISE